MEQSFKNYKLSNLIQDEIDNLKRTKTNNKI